ncbi:hypothetical protein C8J57DRAFT_1229030 [Mycena rebaudengoi]|nr:hypothetical protein C8J57DRAFT_1229030 [Mycena rebaudengoi]
MYATVINGHGALTWLKGAELTRNPESNGEVARKGQVQSSCKQEDLQPIMSSELILEQSLLASAWIVPSGERLSHSRVQLSRKRENIFRADKQDRRNVSLFPVHHGVQRLCCRSEGVKVYREPHIVEQVEEDARA